MGYTHYWNATGRIASKEEWDRLRGYVRDIIGTAQGEGIRVQASYDDSSPPRIDAGAITFNGAGSKGCEDFHLARAGSSAFCKTRQHPYDDVVVATLIAAAHCLPGFRWSSDGDREEHEAGAELAGKVGLSYRREYREPTCETIGTTPHTNDIGIAIRDALDLLRDGIELFDWGAEEDCPSMGHAEIGEIDVSDASNLQIKAGGGVYRVSIVRVG